MASFGSCVGDDIDDLQDQIDDLNGKVVDLEEAQQEALLTEIAALQATIAALQTSMEEGDSNLAAQYDALLSNLQLLEDEVANNEAAVYYGNLLTDADFNAFETQGATIVTGKVIVASQSHVDAIADMKMVGGNLTLSGGTTIDLTALQNVGGSLYLNDLSADGVTVSLPALTSVGDNVELNNNSALVSFVADALVLINASLESMGNPMLATLSFNSLDQVGVVYVDEYNPNDPNYTGLGSLTNLNLSSTNVLEDLDIQWVSGGALSIGTVGGDFYLGHTKLTELVLNSEVIEGDFTFEYNGNLTSIDVSVITMIKGDVAILYNYTDWYDFAAPTGLEELPSFAALESIGGDVRVEGNNYLTSLEIFNSVTSFSGSKISISYNGGAGTGYDYIDMFNALEDGGPSSYTKLDISVWENSSWFNGFNSLIEAKDITLNVAGVMNTETWMTGPTKIEGFGAMTACKSLVLNATDAEEFTAFESLDNFKGWGVTNCLILDMPDVSVGMCSMETIFNKILNGDFDSKPAIFKQNWMEVDKVTAVDQLLAPCANN